MNEARRQPIRNPSAPRILVIEADVDIALLLTCNLKAEGYAAESVGRGDEAELRLAGSPPDLVILDWTLPDESGLEICIRLRARDGTRTLPVIMLTARGKEADRVRGFSAGVDDYVVKPFSMLELMARVRALLRRSRPERMAEILTVGDIVLDRTSQRVRRLQLPTGFAGAWIGTSEFADAAGFAAAQTYGGFAGPASGIAGTADQAVWSFTLMKVVGRDVWIGVWALVLAIISTTRWEPEDSGHKPEAIEIWRRFPKFVLGFLAASLIVTWASRGYSLAEFNKSVAPALVAPVKDLRTWTFIFCFFSIGLTTRIRDLAAAGSKPFAAFSAGVVVNVVLGFVLSVFVFASYWTNLAR